MPLVDMRTLPEKPPRFGEREPRQATTRYDEESVTFMKMAAVLAPRYRAELLKP